MPEPTSNPSILSQLFKAAGISRVVFVDDRFGITFDRIQADANELSVEQLRISGAFPNVDFGSDNEDILRASIEKTIASASPSDLELMFDRMAVIAYQYGDSERDQTARAYFDEIVGEVAETVYLSLKQWEKQRDKLRQSLTTWHRCVIFNPRIADYAASLTKGAHVQLVGEIQTREYVAKDGAKKSVTEIRVQRIARLDRQAAAAGSDEAMATEVAEGAAA